MSIVPIFSVWDNNLYFIMAECLLEQIETPEEKIAKLTAAAGVECPEAKQLSVVAAIPEFVGRPRGLKVREFSEAVNSVGRMRSWTEDDKKCASKFKL